MRLVNRLKNKLKLQVKKLPERIIIPRLIPIRMPIIQIDHDDEEMQQLQPTQMLKYLLQPMQKQPYRLQAQMQPCQLQTPVLQLYLLLQMRIYQRQQMEMQ
jgi:hypothetical protein